MCSHACTHTYMCFCLNGPLWFSHGYLLVISQQQKVKAPNPPTSLSTIVYISFPCLHVALIAQEKKGNISSLVWPLTQLRCWNGGASGLVASSVNLCLSAWDWQFVTMHFLWLMMPKITSDASNKSAIRQGQPTALGMKCLESKYHQSFLMSVINQILFSDDF